MSITLDFNLTSAAIGKSDLSVQFYDAAYSALGSPVTTGFHAWGNGSFRWTGTAPTGWATAICTSASLPAYVMSVRTVDDVVGSVAQLIEDAISNPVTLPTIPPAGYGGGTTTVVSGDGSIISGGQ